MMPSAVVGLIIGLAPLLALPEITRYLSVESCPKLPHFNKNGNVMPKFGTFSQITTKYKVF